MFFQPRTFHQVRGKARLIDPIEGGDIVRHLDTPVQERPLRPDTGKQHRQQGTEDHVAASPQGGMHIPGGRAYYHRKGDPDKQRLIGPLTQRQPAAEEHRRRAPQQHQRQGD
ncbi:hypothetical protein D3C76_1390520 [compost metagenome]